jgi:ABC-2 type transport system ATP-binding protein
MAAVIEVKGLRKAYAGRVAVDGVSFSVQRGEIFGMVGPNGAGKTSIIEALAGLRHPDGGIVRVLGHDPGRERRVLAQRIGVQLQQASLPDRLRVGEALDLFASFYREPADRRRLLDDWDLAEHRTKAFADLSGGERQRLFVALAFMGSPELVFLDELTTGLDPHARRGTWKLIRDIRAKGVTVLLVTHFMDEAEQLCDRIAVVDRGRIVALDRPAVLVGRACPSRAGAQATLDDAFLALTGRESGSTH